MLKKVAMDCKCIFENGEMCKLNFVNYCSDRLMDKFQIYLSLISGLLLYNQLNIQILFYSDFITLGKYLKFSVFH